MTRIKIESNKAPASRTGDAGQVQHLFNIKKGAVDMSTAIDSLREQFIEVARHTYITATARDIELVAEEVLEGDTEHPDIAYGASALVSRFVNEYGMACADYLLDKGDSGVEIDEELLRDKIEEGIISEQLSDCEITYKEANGISRREQMIEDGELDEDSDEEVDEALPYEESARILRDVSYGISVHIAGSDDFTNLTADTHNLAMKMAIPVVIFTNYEDVANSWVDLSDMEDPSEFINKVNSTLSLLSDIVREYAWHGFDNTGKDWDAEDLLDFAVRKFGENRGVDRDFLASGTNVLQLLENLISFVKENGEESVERIYNDTYDNNGGNKIVFGALFDTEDAYASVIAKGRGEALLKRGHDPGVEKPLWESDTNGDILYLANEQFRKLFGGIDLDDSAPVPFILKYNGLTFDLSEITCAGWVYLTPRGFEARRIPSDDEDTVGREDYTANINFDVLFSQSPEEIETE